MISPAARAAVEAWLESRPEVETTVRNLIADLAATLVEFEFSRLVEASQIDTHDEHLSLKRNRTAVDAPYTTTERESNE